MNISLNSSRETKMTAIPNFEPTSFIVYYTGDIKKILSQVPNTNVVLLSPYMAVIFTQLQYESSIKSIKEISIIEPNVPYILTNTSPMESSNIVKFTNGELIDLTGTGVLIGTIDTGIDYLNKEFTREDDTSRILSIWDQTNNTGTPPAISGYGSEYTNAQINEALKANREGRDPYSIVPQRDTNGHGTQCAGIIGARGYGDVKGAAPNCDFLVVKLRPSIIKDLNPSITQYDNTDIATAMLYLLDQRHALNRPLVVFLPVSSNFGEHNGGRPLEQLIDYYSYTSLVAFALGTGNQGNSQTHTSGTIKNSGDVSTVEFQSSKDQRNLDVSIWCTSPDKISMGIVSPSGQIIPKIPVKIDEQEDLKFIYEDTIARVIYFFPESPSGDELITIKFFNIATGIWKILLYGDYIATGKYNVWISQRPLSKIGTFLLNPNNFTTLTIPSTSREGIATAYYDQNNNTIGEFSGVGFTSNNKVKPSVTCGGVNVLTTGLNNTTTTITGSSAATAVLAGAMALLFQWGIVDKNIPNMSSSILKSLIITGTRKRPNDIYPNPYWGYGILDMVGIFDAIRGIYTSNLTSQLERNKNYTNDNIETNIPREAFNRLIFDPFTT
ncbi:MAG: S8 family peptidase [Clostridium sp.]|uniref:S8 family peptidase n=1 Tax=Clostridium sp. TaxID=1506 RepID=UPI003020FDED